MLLLGDSPQRDYLSDRAINDEEAEKSKAKDVACFDSPEVKNMIITLDYNFSLRSNSSSSSCFSNLKIGSYPASPLLLLLSTSGTLKSLGSLAAAALHLRTAPFKIAAPPTKTATEQAKNEYPMSSPTFLPVP